MRKKIYILLIFLSATLHSQVQKRFYVSDAKTVDYVTVKFCVNDSARISDVKVLLEKTTYTNQGNIEKLIEYLKSVQYYPDSKLRNNCYDSTFDFVNSVYENATLNETEFSKCTEFRSGEFRYKDVRYLKTKVIRKDNFQTEESDDFNAEYEINWISPNEYEMRCVKVKEEENQNLVGQIIKVKIIGLTGPKSYLYMSDLPGRPTYIGEIEKID